MTTKNQKTAAIIVAAGEGKRMGGLDKVLAPLAGEPILLHAVRPFQASPLVSQIIVVVGGGKEPACRRLLTGPLWSKVTEVCLGGQRRQDSVAAGLATLKDCDWVIIHDGARPLVTVELIERGLEAARETGAAIAAVPVTDTIKVSGENDTVLGTPPRQSLWAVQTPQVFRADIIAEAYQKDSPAVTDDAALVEKLGYKVKLFTGSYDNIKITTPRDLSLAEIIIREREG